MGGAPEPQGTPPPVVKGIATLATLRVGVKAMVEKDGDKRKAEILSIQQRKGRTTFYVHYEEFNKRLDEWIPADRIDLSQEVEWPAPEKPADQKDGDGKTTGGNNKKKVAGAAAAAQQKAQQQKAAAAAAAAAAADKKSGLKRKLDRETRDLSGTPESSSGNVIRPARPSLAGGKENNEDAVSTPRDDDDTDMVDVQAAAAQATKGSLAGEHYSREEEIEKLRTSGSMTQNQAEVSRVRNLEKIQMGKHEIEPWYFSPYPIEFGDEDMVYICEFCLGYFGEVKQFERHRAKCTLQHPPGNEIYRDDYISFFEIDGRRQRTWCRNLCLLSKLFLDHKTLYYDVDPFLFYCMATRDEYGCHLVGYFSKEKESAEGYNVACILTLPQYQRKGFGRLLIQFSYELSRKESKLGSPEKPLSDLGLLGYRAYWQETIVDMLMDGRAEANIEDLANRAAMTTNDVLHTLQNLNMIRMSRNQHVIVLTDAVIQQREKQKEKERLKGKRHYIDGSKLIWKPPVFTASSRTWNW